MMPNGLSTDGGFTQFYQWGVEKLFQNSDEAITGELKVYIEDSGNRISITIANHHVSYFLQNMVVWL